jgi:predicted ATPase with chaperone activity
MTVANEGIPDDFRQRLAALLAEHGGPSEGDDPWLAIAQQGAAPRNQASDLPPVPATVVHKRAVAEPGRRYVPRAPETLEETGLSQSEVEALVMKYLLNTGAASGRQISDHLHLPFRVMERLLRQLKEALLVVYRGSAPLSDYVYELTEVGHERARRYSQRCTYFGTAPVSLADYVTSVRAQSITLQSPTLKDLRRAFAELVLGEEILSQIGQAANSGLGLFLYGAPGNGKTSIAERIIRAFGQEIWIPRAISVFGEIVRLYDPSSHEMLPAAADKESEIDGRWIRIRRPTIIVGGELTMDSLEIVTSKTTGISEAPLQMKANCGTLVIDDFGRQRCSTAELLNRWIVPLEKRYDYLTLGNGRKIEMPFDQLIVFSTNLEPRALVDEAFLRRIPYKIDVRDPSEQEFRELMRSLAAEMGIQHREDVVDHLIQSYYRATGRTLRFCHPRDLLRQVKIYCSFLELPLVLTREAIDAAVRNYFAMM